ncbi:M23 family metallopeptidase [Burkholderia territorii]|uniref:M23 family metallopeptidase n=1 Tax=Burkholderia territorii TaxID=1503055 RepID=UPI0009BE800E
MSELQDPCPRGRISSFFGQRSSGFHNGLDIAAPIGTAVYGAKDGVVERASWNDSFGNVVVIRHSDGTATLYAHLSSMEVNLGDKVESGEKIGEVGDGGESRGAHLHFEYLRLPDKVRFAPEGNMGLRTKDYGVDPALYLTKASVPPTLSETSFFQQLIDDVKASLSALETAVDDFAHKLELAIAGDQTDPPPKPGAPYPPPGTGSPTPPVSPGTPPKPLPPDPPGPPSPEPLPPEPLPPEPLPPEPLPPEPLPPEPLPPEPLPPEPLPPEPLPPEPLPPEPLPPEPLPPEPPQPAPPPEPLPPPGPGPEPGPLP